MMKHLALCCLLLVSAVATAETIKFPEEELARESVLPIFDRRDSVQNRTVVTAKRFEFGVLGGWTMTDAFFNQLSIGGLGTYHFNEVHGLNLMASYRFAGTSQYSEQLNSIRGVTPLHMEFAPAPKYIGLLQYQYTAYYGKMSLSKLSVGNLSLFGLFGVGMTGIGDGNFPTVSLGIGQKYYFSRTMALRFDLLFLAYQGPNILSSQVDLSRKAETQSTSGFPKKTMYDTMLTAGLVYLLPGG